MKRASITEELAYGNALDRLTGENRKAAAPTIRQPAAKFSGGKKISKTRLIEAMVKAFRQSKLDVRGVKTDEELYKRVIAQMR